MSEIKDELNRRKETLDDHFDKFMELKQRGKIKEAWDQLVITLNYASETLRYSTEVLKRIESNDEVKTQEIMTKNDESNKLEMIVIPKEPTIH